MIKHITNIMIYSLITSNFAAAQSNPEVNQEPEGKLESSKPYEIVITPTISRTKLRELIADVEEDFYEKFNELNIDDSYDIVCYKHTPTMSHIWRRVCEPWFMLQSRGDMASQVTFLLGHGSPSANESAIGMMKSDRQLIREKKRSYEELQMLMEEFSRSDSEFRQIGEVLAELKYRFENYGDL